MLVCVAPGGGPGDGEGGQVVLSTLDELKPWRSEQKLEEHGGQGGLSSTDTTNAAKTDPKAPAAGPGKVCNGGSGSVEGLQRQ